MNLPRLICFMGIDGSGKTTLAKELVKASEAQGIRYRYVWGNAQPIFLRPLRALAHLTILRKADMKKDNSNYERAKEEASTKFGFVSRIYSLVLILDYFIWLFIKVRLPLIMGKKIICDRYVFDVAVNLHFLNKSLYPDSKQLVHFFLRYFPSPDLLFFIDISPEVAFLRKADIPSVSFLQRRQAVYRQLGQEYKAIVLNGADPIPVSLSKVVQNI